MGARDQLVEHRGQAVQLDQVSGRQLTEDAVTLGGQPHPDDRLFTALVSTHDGTEQPGNQQVSATMVVVGRRHDDCLGAGDAFNVWRGADMARGVITRRLFT